ncbi:unnamed protein product [Linum trigynum]|uniref:HTH CENPB-type domain-containing protein n=1 Tax=Linum trigynum TaxID=586398 RepID=A0AAV2DHS9_9ROSI
MVAHLPCVKIIVGILKVHYNVLEGIMLSHGCPSALSKDWLWRFSELKSTRSKKGIMHSHGCPSALSEIAYSDFRSELQCPRKECAYQ